MVLEFFYFFIKGQRAWKLTLNRARSNIVVIFLICYRHFYPRVLYATISLFRCQDLGDPDANFLDDNPNIICWGNFHKQIMFGVTITGVILWSLIFPVSVLFFIFKRRRLLAYKRIFNQTKEYFSEKKEIRPQFKGKIKVGIKTWKKKDKKEDGDLPQQINPISNISDNFSREDFIFFYITVDYKESLYYWICAEYLFMFILVFTSQLISSLDDIIKRMILLTTFCGKFLLYQIAKPFVLSIHMTMVCLSIFVCILTITFQLVGSYKDSTSMTRELAKLLILLSNIIFYVCSLYNILKIIAANKIRLFWRRLSKFLCFK